MAFNSDDNSYYCLGTAPNYEFFKYDFDTNVKTNINFNFSGLPPGNHISDGGNDM
jgi:hypothetical protein